jgi:hypothetical protein
MSLRLLGLVLLLAPATLAQVTEAQAVAQVKSAAKTQLATFKSTTKAALATLDTALTEIEAGLDPEDHPSDIAMLIGDALVTFYTSAENAWSNAIEVSGDAAAGALGDLADGGDLAGQYPASLYAGSGGVLDAHRKAVLKAATKLREAAVKRLAKTASRCEKLRGFSLNVRLSLPAAALAFSVNQQTTSQIDEGPRLNVLIAMSALDATEDGVILVEGTSGDESDDATVSWRRTFGETDSEDVDVDLSSGHFQALFLGVLEGGYAVSVQQTAGPVHDVAEIGVR